jgi:MazG family protein
MAATDDAAETADEAASATRTLLEIMARLRDPQSGCAWDLEQTFETIAPYTIEEAYEVDDAIRRGDLPALRDELGDLLLQVVFHARMAEEARQFDFAAVARGVSEKLVRRHPNVFGDANVESAAAQVEAWEAQKARERARRGETSVADGLPLGLPALLRAHKLLGRARRAGFAWASAREAFAKVEEELAEVRQQLDADDAARLEEELGDLLLATAGLARQVGVDPEQALRSATAKFEARLRALERGLAAEGRTLSDARADELRRRWRER